MDDLRTDRRRAALLVLCVVLFLTFLDNTIISVSLADIQSRLGAGVQTLQWVVDGYALTFASFMLAGFSSWCGVFWFNLGLGAIAFVAAVVVPECADPQGSFDIWGSVLGATALAAAIFAVISAEMATSRRGSSRLPRISVCSRSSSSSPSTSSSWRTSRPIAPPRTSCR
jgi:hypothetical protein